MSSNCKKVPFPNSIGVKKPQFVLSFGPAVSKNFVFTLPFRHLGLTRGRPNSGIRLYRLSRQLVILNLLNNVCILQIFQLNLDAVAVLQSTTPTLSNPA